MRQWWKDLSVVKKLYVVVGVMAILIAIELFTLLFAMDTLSAVRSFIAGESFWSKGQKNAIYSLHRYVNTRNPIYYSDFKNAQLIALGDREARLELEKPNPNLDVVRRGLIQGQNHPQDIDGVVKLLLRFSDNRYISSALVAWRKADELFDQVIQHGENIHSMISNETGSSEKIQEALSEIDRLNVQLTEEEKNFSHILGEGSRWMEQMLMVLLVLAVLTVESTGLLLTVAFSRNLNRSLRELAETAKEVGSGNFSHEAPVRSRDELGQLAGAINGMIRDLRRNIGQKIKAENANQVKTLFLASMSHEIRTPLGVILGMVDILKDPTLPWNERLKYIETIERTGKNLNRIINDILDISKVETGHLEIEKSQFPLPELLQDLQSMMRIKAASDNNELNFIKQGDVPDKIFTDRIRLRQILVNLINNALKFTKNGNVTLTYCMKGSHLCFQITDNGVGISGEDQNRLFQPYFQAEETAQKMEGTGLGLVLSKRLAQALGGDVTLKDSKPGVGSTFVATVLNESVAEPKVAVEQNNEKPAPPVTHDTLQGKKVLVVEDVIDNQMLTRLYLSRKGMKVHFANNGAEGVQKAMHEEFDLILMDMQMPVMDGYTATRTLREKGFHKPIIAVTAHAMKEDRDRCLQAGCDDYLTKPLDSNALYETIYKNLDQQA